MSCEHSTPSVATPSPEFTRQERALLLRLARQTIERVVALESVADLEPVDLPPRCRERRACFVTLTKNGRLRGCIGTLVAGSPLFEAVIDNARGAALRDTRFQPVTPEEVPHLSIEISVLSPLRLLRFHSPQELLDQLDPGRDGVVLHVDGRRSTFLPQVWEDIPDKTSFLDRLCLKADAARGAWRLPGTEVEVYTVESFFEGE